MEMGLCPDLFCVFQKEKARVKVWVGSSRKALQWESSIAMSETTITAALVYGYKANSIKADTAASLKLKKVNLWKQELGLATVLLN